jgi:hypothetical protein
MFSRAMEMKQTMLKQEMMTILPASDQLSSSQNWWTTLDTLRGKEKTVAVCRIPESLLLNQEE